MTQTQKTIIIALVFGGTMITIAGKPCSGKSAISKELEKEHGFERFSMGDMFREIAKDNNLDVDELNKMLTSPKTALEFNIDSRIDNKVKELGGKKIREYVIIETRTGFIFIPESHKVYTIVEPREQALRLINSGRDTEKTDVTIQQAIENLANRERMENERFMHLYNRNNLAITNYDYVLNTTHLSISKASEQVYNSYLDYRKRKYGTERPQEMER